VVNSALLDDKASLASIGREKMRSLLPSADFFEPRSVLPSTATKIEPGLVFGYG